MPGYRSGRGGARRGTPGKKYPNRTDLSTAKPVPIQAAPGGQYGSAKASIEAQRAVPMASGPQGAPAPGGLPDMTGLPSPDSLPSLFADSLDPTEDVMSGARLGPGPGPEAFNYGPEAQAKAGDDWTAKYLPALEHAANSRTGTPAARQIIRLLKAGTGLSREV